ncbi:hypothetical protein [Aurantiacibacter flavus]|uniref:Tetratricopeptide repeat protein n=1 Tax=Aurantiacibacter flavus TaxID=3145232 RepID=A0ABV0CXP4_9SPHN
MNLYRLAIPFALVPLTSAPVSATTLFPQNFTCPVGGEEFEDYVIGSTSSWGQRPDGKAIGGVSPWPVIECPTNGFPIYQEEFNDEEVAQLADLIATPEFMAMRESDTSYRRIWWLRKQMGADAYSQAWYLLAASWQADDSPELKSRYQRDFAIAADALSREAGMADDWLWYTLRAANAYRELGQFDDAQRLLAEVDQPALLPEDEDERAGARRLIDGLAALVSEKNTYFEPTNLVGARNSAERCEGPREDLTAVEVHACESQPHSADIRELDEYRDDSMPAEAAMADANGDWEAVEAALEAVDTAAEAAATAPFSDYVLAIPQDD